MRQADTHTHIYIYIYIYICIFISFIVLATTSHPSRRSQKKCTLSTKLVRKKKLFKG